MTENYFTTNRITTKSKSAVLRLRFFRVAAARQELALVRTADARKNKALLPQGCFCFWSLMARGGRENGAKRRNPDRAKSPETASQISERLIFYNLDNICTTSLTILPCCHLTFLLNISPVRCANHIQQ